MGQCMGKLQGWWTNKALGVKSAMLMYNVKGTAQPAPWEKAQLNKSTQCMFGGKVPHKAQRVLSFHVLLKWTKIQLLLI